VSLHSPTAPLVSVGESSEDRGLLEFASSLHGRARDGQLTNSPISEADGPKATRTGQPHFGGVVQDEVDETFEVIARFLRKRREQTQGPRTTTNVQVTDRWEGVVTSVSDELVEAQFAPIGKRAPTLSATFVLSEIDPDDLELVRPGALFYLVATRVQISARWWQPSSSLHFRRIPPPSDAEVAEAEAYAVELHEELGREI